MLGPTLSPSDLLAENDPGDETQRNFRYQYGYGAILLISAYTGHSQFIALWCEHHEDFLTETSEGTFEAFQIKTRKPENGEWTLSDEEMKKSLKRFVQLQKKFKEKIIGFNIVSNAAFMTCDPGIGDQKRVMRSIILLLEAVRVSENPHLIPTKFSEVISTLSKDLGCSIPELYTVLARTKLINGPSREGFDSEIAHNHLTRCEECKKHDFATLNKIRDEIIQRIFLASSLSIDTASEHLQDVQMPSGAKLAGKRLEVSIIKTCISEADNFIFRYQPTDSTLAIAKGSSTNILIRKLQQGNLDSMVKTFVRRTISAEEKLLEASYDPAFDIENLLKQLESVVQGECDEAALEALTETGSLDHVEFGRKMYLKLAQRLKDISENRSTLVNSEPFETLIGIAGLLSENCSVWWSNKFNLTD